RQLAVPFLSHDFRCGRRCHFAIQPKTNTRAGSDSRTDLTLPSDTYFAARIDPACNPAARPQVQRPFRCSRLKAGASFHLGISARPELSPKGRILSAREVPVDHQNVVAGFIRSEQIAGRNHANLLVAFLNDPMAPLLNRWAQLQPFLDLDSK